MKKILVILGPTASGKSELAVRLAKKLSAKGGPAYGWNGAEIVSADSRQVYKGLDIGTGKITQKEMRGVPHHLLDVARPQKRFSVEDYKKLAETVIDKIIEKKRLPIICGGTGFYIQAIVDGIIPPPVEPNLKLRNMLKQKSVSQLFSILKKLDPKRAGAIDHRNPRRLTRAIEIATALGKVPKLKSRPRYATVQIGIKIPDAELRRKIKRRLLQRLNKGMVVEARRLHKKGLSWKRMDELGMEYKYLAEFLQKKISRKDMIEKIYTANCQYAKRQMTWFKRDKRIKWMAGPPRLERGTVLLERTVLPLKL